MTPLDLVKLPRLMELSAGRPEFAVGLIDGPVAIGHPDLAGKIWGVPGSSGRSCAEATSAACLHGTFVAGVLSARRGSPAPAICPDCTIIVRPVFAEAATENLDSPSAEPEELAAAIPFASAANPIARASRTMAECSTLAEAHARRAAE